jgi:hypothetical protein
VQPFPSPLNFFEEEPLSWPLEVRAKPAKSAELDSHRGGQGFESPQLHPNQKVRGVIRLGAVPPKIICHSDVTGTRQAQMTPRVPG